MANNEYVNKVLFGNTTVMDISDTTAETEDVIEGQVFYTKSGAPAVGSLGDATTSTHGLMSAEDKVKLDNINEIQIDKTLDTSAAIMSFPDGADGMPVKSLSVAVEPVQDLHGYDNPWPAGGGKNLVQNNSVSEVIDGVTFTVHSDGTVTANGTASAEIYFNIKSGLSLEAGSYVLSGCPAGGSTSTYRIFATNVGSDIGSSLAFTFNETTATTVRINIKSGTTITNLLFKPMICLSSAQNPTTFAPYSNICPITGWTGAKVQRTGKNLFDYTKITVDRRIDITNGNAVGVGSDIFRVSDYIRVKQNTKYTMNFSYYSSGNYGMAFYNKSKAFISGLRQGAASGTTPFTFTTPSNTEYIRFTTVTSDISTNAVQCEEGDSATSFEQYRGSTYPITFPSSAGTVYGGTLTVNEDGTGVLVVDKGYFTENGTANWSRNESGSFYLIGQDTNVATNSGGLCNYSTYVYSNSAKYSIYARPNGQIAISYGYTSVWPNIATLKAAFSQNPLQVVYPLATPQTYNLTDIEVIETLKGVNNIWADTGDINSITYSKLTSGLINTYDKVKLDQIEGLPPVTSSDNNKILQVTNGVWDAATLTNANSSVAGLMSATDKTKLDGIMAGANKPVFLTYGSSTWSDAITAYNNGAQLYCLASNSMDTPGSGTMNRIVQLVYVAIGSDDTIPYQFEFQYYRSLSSKTLSALSDQILVYKLDQNDGWSFSYRYISIEEVSASNGITASYNNNILSLSGPGIMTGATSSTAGTSGSVPAPTTSDVDKFLAGDGTYKSGGLPMVILSYGNSTWAEFEAAYKNNVIVYCRASSNSNPASGSQTRMAFMAYVNNATTPTEVEFQYYRSMSSHSATQMGDQVFVYKLTKTAGWSVTTRDASIKEINVATGSKLGVSWSSNKVTLSNTMTADDMPMSASDATTVDSAITSLSGQIGTLSSLTTTNKSDLVSAVNEVNGNIMKVRYADVTCPITTSTGRTAVYPAGITGFTLIGATIVYNDDLYYLNVTDGIYISVSINDNQQIEFLGMNKTMSGVGETRNIKVRCIYSKNS